MDLTPAQSKIVVDEHRFRVVVCGRKFGKTTLGSEELIANTICANNQRVLYIAPTLGDARRLMWDRLRKQLGASVEKENDTRLELRVRTPYGGTSELFLGSWELVNNYRGDEFDFELYDEVQDYRNFWVGWQEAMRPTLTPRIGEALFMGTSKGFNHLYDLYNLEADPNYPEFKSFHFTTYDNPYINREEIEEAKRTLPSDRFAQEYLAEFRKAEGLVFKEFERSKHIFTEEMTGYSEKVGGVDFGYTNPAAIVTVVVKDGTYYVTNLLYRTGMTDLQVAEYVAAKNYAKVYPDPESPSAIAEMKNKGVNVREVDKGRDSIKHGIDKVRELFLANKLFIHSSCLDLIGELESYRYPEPRTFHNLNENPLDENNHAIDALRYVIASHSLKKIIPAHKFYDKTIDIWRQTPNV